MSTLLAKHDHDERHISVDSAVLTFATYSTTQPSLSREALRHRGSVAPIQSSSSSRSRRLSPFTDVLRLDALSSAFLAGTASFVSCRPWI